MTDDRGPWPVPFPSQIARWRHGAHQPGAYEYGAAAIIRVGADSIGGGGLRLSLRVDCWTGDPRAWEKWIGVIACLLLASFGSRARAGSVMVAPVALEEMSLDPPDDGGSARPRSFPSGSAIGRDDSDSFMMNPIDQGRRPRHAERVSGQLRRPLTLFSAAAGQTKLDILSITGVPLSFWVASGSFPSHTGVARVGTISCAREFRVRHGRWQRLSCRHRLVSGWDDGLCTLSLEIVPATKRVDTSYSVLCRQTTTHHINGGGDGWAWGEPMEPSQDQIRAVPGGGLRASRKADREDNTKCFVVLHSTQRNAVLRPDRAWATKQCIARLLTYQPVPTIARLSYTSTRGVLPVLVSCLCQVAPVALGSQIARLLVKCLAPGSHGSDATEITNTLTINPMSSHLRISSLGRQSLLENSPTIIGLDGAALERTCHCFDHLHGSRTNCGCCPIGWRGCLCDLKP